MAAMARLFKSCLQGDFGGRHKNFEAVVLEGADLWHWWRDNSSPGNPWNRGQRIISGRAAFPASIIQSDFRSGDHGNFEVVAALHSQGGLIELWHMWHDNSDVNKPWSFGQRITEPGRRVVGPASIIQSDFKSGDHGNFEVIVPVINDAGQVELRHYWHDNSDVGKPWARGQRVNDPTHEVLGGGCLIQSDFRSGDHGNFEVAAWVRLPGQGAVLQHYWHDNSDVTLPWRNGQVMAVGAKGNGVMIQGSFRSDGHGNFEGAVPVEGPEGRTYIQHIWHDNSDVSLPWRPGQVISEVGAADASACLMESDYGDGRHGNFEVLFDECRQALVGWWHANDDVNRPWLRHAALLPDAPVHEVRATERICQLTGEFDRTGWDGNPEHLHHAFNQTEARFGIRGTDLGVSFEHKNLLYFLFGDTWRVGESADDHFDWDAIASCSDTRVDGGLSLKFYRQPPVVPGINQGGFDVPLDGFSRGGRMFVFFSTDAVQLGDNAVMGRSVLAVSDNDGHDFVPLFTLSHNKFINVSIERARLDALQARALNWPAGTEVLWLWGSGRYRSSPVYLAAMDIDRMLRAVNTGTHDSLPDGSVLGGSIGALRFLRGNANGARWSAVEQEAVPLFCAGDVGELSCRRNAIFNRYFLTYNSSSPRGIVLRYSPQPWGPWSGPIVIFDPSWGSAPGQPIGAGYGRFMHIPWSVAKVDRVQDDMFQHGWRNNDWGGEYGPYQIPRVSTGTHGVRCELYYTMSTWNPYESMLMRTQIDADDLRG